MGLLITLLVNAFTVFLLAYLLPGVDVDSVITAFIVALLLGVVNTFIRPVIVFFTIPLTIVTLGLFILVINALLVLLVDALVPGFTIDGFLMAFLFSLLLSLVSSFLQNLAK